MSVFILFLDDTKTARVRFVDALVAHRDKVLRSHAGPPIQFLVETLNRDGFARACGGAGRPAITEAAPRARPASAPRPEIPGVLP